MAPRFTNEQRLQICKYKEANASLSQAEVAAWIKGKFGLTSAPSQVTISKILKKKHDYELIDEHELHAKRLRTVNFPDLEEALSLWVLQCQHWNVFITYDLIKAQGQRFAEMLKILEGNIEFSNGWLYKFLSRNKLKSFKIHGEAGSVDDDAIEAAMPALRAPYRCLQSGRCLQYGRNMPFFTVWCQIRQLPNNVLLVLKRTKSGSLSHSLQIPMGLTNCRHFLLDTPRNLVASIAKLTNRLDFITEQIKKPG